MIPDQLPVKAVATPTRSFDDNNSSNLDFGDDGLMDFDDDAINWGAPPATLLAQLSQSKQGLQGSPTTTESGRLSSSHANHVASSPQQQGKPQVKDANSPANSCDSVSSSSMRYQILCEKQEKEMQQSHQSTSFYRSKRPYKSTRGGFIAGGSGKIKSACNRTNFLLFLILSLSMNPYLIIPLLPGYAKPREQQWNAFNGSGRFGQRTRPDAEYMARGAERKDNDDDFKWGASTKW